MSQRFHPDRRDVYVGLITFHDHVVEGGLYVMLDLGFKRLICHSLVDDFYDVKLK